MKELTTRFKTQLEKGKMKVAVAYTYDQTKAVIFKSEIEKALQPYGLQVEFVDPLSLSVSCHIGENALAIACCECY